MIWTRGRGEPDLVPQIRDWFAEDGFVPVWMSDPAQGWGVGAQRFTANPVPLQRGARMFRFTGRPPTLIFIPNGPGACPAALSGLAWALRPAGSLRPAAGHQFGDLVLALGQRARRRRGHPVAAHHGQRRALAGRGLSAGPGR